MTPTPTNSDPERPGRRRRDLAEAVRILREHQDLEAFARITFFLHNGRITRAEINRQRKLGEGS